MTRFALTLEFDGGPFMGLQRQAHGPSVQQAVEEAVFAVTGEDVRMAAAGRTDTGVHALAMVAHVDIARDIAPFRLMEALNAHLRPAPIAVLACEVKPDDWHARFSCTGRSYLYGIVNRRAPLALERGRAWHVTQPLDTQAMHRAAQAPCCFRCHPHPSRDCRKPRNDWPTGSRHSLRTWLYPIWPTRLHAGAGTARCGQRCSPAQARN